MSQERGLEGVVVEEEVVDPGAQSRERRTLLLKKSWIIFSEMMYVACC